MNIETANRLLKYRKSRGYSQEELAEKIGVSRQAISKWERSEASPDTDNLIMLAKIYGVTLDELIQGESDPAQTQTETADDNRYVDEPDPDTNYVKEEKVSFKRGIHVDDKNGQVDISFKEGINVNSSDGSHVHVGRDGVHVYDGEKVRAYTDENGNVMVDEELKGMSKHSKHIADRVPVWAISLIAMLVWGFSGVAFGFALSWICLLAIPIYHSLVDAIYKKNPSHFAYPVLCVAEYMVAGFFSILGGWSFGWIVFLTIPLYYGIVSLFHHK